MSQTCENCDLPLEERIVDAHHTEWGPCPRCQLYNAAVAAQRVGALALAESRLKNCTVKRAWVNDHGVFAETDAFGAIQVATGAEAEPLAMLTTRSLRVEYPKPEGRDA